MNPIPSLLPLTARARRRLGTHTLQHLGPLAGLASLAGLAAGPRRSVAAMLSPVLLAALTACGGGGGGGDEPKSSSAAPAPVVTVGTLVPAATMTWRTAAEQAIDLTVHTAEGLPAAGAAVRVFTLSRTSPQDGATLEEPVPVSLLDSAVTDATGRLNLGLRWPAHETELLLVATDGDQQARGVLSAQATGTQRLTLGR